MLRNWLQQMQWRQQTAFNRLGKQGGLTLAFDAFLDFDRALGHGLGGFNNNRLVRCRSLLLDLDHRVALARHFPTDTAILPAL